MSAATKIILNGLVAGGTRGACEGHTNGDIKAEEWTAILDALSEWRGAALDACPALAAFAGVSLTAPAADALPAQCAYLAGVAHRVPSLTAGERDALEALDEVLIAALRAAVA